MRFLSNIFDELYLWAVVTLFFIWGVIYNFIDSILTTIIPDSNFPERQRELFVEIRKRAMSVILFATSGLVGFLIGRAIARYFV